MSRISQLFFSSMSLQTQRCKNVKKLMSDKNYTCSSAYVTTLVGPTRIMARLWFGETLKKSSVKTDKTLLDLSTHFILKPAIIHQFNFLAKVSCRTETETKISNKHYSFWLDRDASPWLSGRGRCCRRRWRACRCRGTPGRRGTACHAPSGRPACSAAVPELKFGEGIFSLHFCIALKMSSCK